MADLSPDEAIAKLQKLPEEQQKQIVGKLAPDAKKALLDRIKSLTSDVSAGDPKQGTYAMYGRLPGQGESVGVLHVPYGRVEDALQRGFTFHENSADQYQKDKAAEGKTPGVFGRISEGIESALEPVEDPVPIPLGGPIQNTNQLRAAGRVVAGLPGYLKDLATTAYGVARGETSPEDLVDLVDPAKMGEQMYNQFQNDWQKDPKLAVDNLIGTLSGLATVGAVSHGMGDISLPGGKSIKEHVRGGIRDTLGVSENTEKAVNRFGRRSERVRNQHVRAEEQTEREKGKVDDARTENLKKHAEVLQKHVDDVRKLSENHRKTVEEQDKKHADALKKHQDDTKAQQQANIKKQQEYLQASAKIAKDNEAAEKIVETRKKAEQQVTDETSDFRQRIAKAETNAKAADDNAWDAWRNKLGNAQADMTPVVDEINSQADKMNPNQVAEFRDILKQAGPPEGTSFEEIRDDASTQAFGAKYDSLAQHQKDVIDQDLAQRGIKAGANAQNVLASRLHGWKTELERAVRTAKDGNVRHAIGKVLDSVRKLEGDVSKQHNALSELEAARKLHGPYVDAFVNSPNEPPTVASAVEKKIAPEAVKETTEQGWLKQLGDYDPEIPKLAESIRQAQEALDKIPTEDKAREMVKPFLPPPTPGALPKRPEAPLPISQPEYPQPPTPPEEKAYSEPKANAPLPNVPDLQQENLRYINKGLQKYGRVGAWILRLITGGLTSYLAKGSGISVFSGDLLIGQTAVTLLTRVLRSPSTLEWLARPSAEDIKMIDSLPPQDAARFREAIGMLAAEEKRANPKKALEFKVAPAIATFLAGGSAAHEERKDNPADLMKQADDLRNGFHKAGFAPANQ